MAEFNDNSVDEKQHFFDCRAPGWDEKHRGEEEKIRALVAELELHPGDTVLEPGCGTGQVSSRLLSRLGPGGRLLALDISRAMLAGAAEKKFSPPAAFIQAEAGCLPIRPGAADAVVCFRVFPHLADRQRALAEFNRVLKSGGRLAIAHLAGRERLNALHARAGGAVAHDRLPAEPEMRELLGSFGFEIKTLEDREERYLLVAIKK